MDGSLLVKRTSLLKVEWLVGWHFATLVGWLVGWSCGALEQLGLSCGGRLAAHIVGGRPRPWGGQRGVWRGGGPRG